MMSLVLQMLSCCKDVRSLSKTLILPVVPKLLLTEQLLEVKGRGSSVISGRVTGRKSMLLCKVATTQSPEREAGIKRLRKLV